jgi:hypothetical protein
VKKFVTFLTQIKTRIDPMPYRHQVHICSILFCCWICLILWSTDPLLGNDLVNTFPWKRTCATIGSPLLGNGSVNKPSQQQRLFSAWSVLMGYKGTQKVIWVSCCWELGRVLEMAVEGDWEEMASNESDCAKKTSCMIWSDSETVKSPLPGYD